MLANHRLVDGGFGFEIHRRLPGRDYVVVSVDRGLDPPLVRAVRHPTVPMNRVALALTDEALVCLAPEVMGFEEAVELLYQLIGQAMEFRRAGRGFWGPW